MRNRWKAPGARLLFTRGPSPPQSVPQSRLPASPNSLLHAGLFLHCLIGCIGIVQAVSGLCETRVGARCTSYLPAARLSEFRLPSCSILVLLGEFLLV